MRLRSSIWLCAVGLTAVGCGGSGEVDAGSSEAGPTDAGPYLDAPGDLEPVPDPCTSSPPSGVPVLVFDWARTPITYLPPGTLTGPLGLDYSAADSFVTSIVFTDAFDTLTRTETYTYTADCPVTVELGELGLDGLENVYRAKVSAFEDEGRLVDGELIVSAGTGSLTLRTDAIVADEGDGSWWAFFQPAPGEARFVVQPITLGRSTVVLEGIPTPPFGEVAILRTTQLREDTGTHVIYADASFAEGWRSGSEDWYGAIIDPANLPREVTLEPVVSTATIEEAMIQPFASHEPYFDVEDEGVWQVYGFTETPTLLFACRAEAVNLHVLSFVEVELADGRVIGPGEQLAIDSTCADGDTTWSVPITTRSWTGLDGTLALRRVSR